MRVQKYQLISLKEWFKTDKPNLIDSLRFYARTNNIPLREMIGTVGRLSIVNDKDENKREFSTVVSYIPEFDEEMIITA